MKPPSAPTLVLAVTSAVVILAAGVCFSPLTTTGRRLRAQPLGLSAETAQVTITEPSGAAFHPARGTILVASDEGGLWELALDGTRIDRFDIPGDLEAVAVHPQTGTAFLALERALTVLEYDLNSRQTIRVLHLEPSRGLRFTPHHNPNHEIEGLCIVTEPQRPSRLVIAWESRPARIAVLDADLSPQASEEARRTTERSGRPLSSTIRVQRAFAIGVRQLSGLAYEPGSRLLVALSAQDRTISVCDLHGGVLARFRLTISKPEGICLLPGGAAVITQEDRDRIWFCHGLKQVLAAQCPIAGR
jgi:uncharacterized protein YjiK